MRGAGVCSCGTASKGVHALPRRTRMGLAPGTHERGYALLTRRALLDLGCAAMRPAFFYAPRAFGAQRLRAPSARRILRLVRSWGFSTSVQFCDILGDHRLATPVRPRPPFRFTSSSSHFVLVAFSFSLSYVRSHVQASLFQAAMRC